MDEKAGNGTEESHRRLEVAVELLYPFTYELFVETDYEKSMREEGIGVNLEGIREKYVESVHSLLTEIHIEVPTSQNLFAKGKQGVHSEHMGYILTEFQYMQRAYPNMEW